MAQRGEVYRLKRAIGFGPRGGEEHVVVLQADDLNAVLPTTVVAPLVSAVRDDANDPRTIPITQDESGVRASLVAVMTQLHALPLDRLDAGAVGRLHPSTLRRVNDVLSLVLSL